MSGAIGMPSNAPTTADIARSVRGVAGYSLDLHLGADELACARRLIEEQWLSHLRRHAADVAEDLAALGIARYHELADRLPHASLWPKSARILTASAVAELRAMPFMARLEAAFGPFTISDEDAVGWPEIYWRLVRPRQPGDMGPLHADRWFWELGHGTTPPDVERIKVWVAVATEPGRNGLRLVPGSHRRAWRYHGELRDGMRKPVLDEDERQLGAILVDTAPGDAVVFHDALLHGGASNDGTSTRVSFEFTMFVGRAGAKQR